jgi:hypothetical protein
MAGTGRGRRLGRWLGRGLLILLAGVVVLALGLRLRYGGGETRFPRRLGEPVRGAGELIAVASLPLPPGKRIDRQGRLWTLDNANHGLGQPRLLAFDLASGELVQRHDFPRQLAPRGSHLNDLQVTPDGRHVLIADASIFGLDLAHPARRLPPDQPPTYILAGSRS